MYEKITVCGKLKLVGHIVHELLFAYKARVISVHVFDGRTKSILVLYTWKKKGDSLLCDTSPLGSLSYGCNQWQL